VRWTHADTGQWRDQAAGEHVFAANYGAVLLSDHPFLSFDDCLFLSLLFYVSGGFCVVAFWSARVLATYDGLKCIVFTVQNRDRCAAMNIFVVTGFTLTGKASIGGNLQCLRLGTSVAWLWDERNMRSDVYIHPLTTMYDLCSVMWSGGLVNKAAPLWDFDPAFSALLCYLH
jgi:hypothetical protein